MVQVTNVKLKKTFYIITISTCYRQSTAIQQVWFMVRKNNKAEKTQIALVIIGIITVVLIVQAASIRMKYSFI